MMYNRAVAAFFEAHYGTALWAEIISQAHLTQARIFDMDDDPRLRRRLIAAGARRLGKSPAEILEDMGTWLVQIDPIRRLLRFSGRSFAEFVESLVELPGRAGMVLPQIPDCQLSVISPGPGRYVISLHRSPPGWTMIMAGAIRAMADDYGALAMISVLQGQIALWIASAKHGVQRPFSLRNAVGRGP